MHIFLNALYELERGPDPFEKNRVQLEESTEQIPAENSDEIGYRNSSPFAESVDELYKL